MTSDALTTHLHATRTALSSLVSTLLRLRPAAKVGIVVGGYVLAVAVALAAVRIYIASTGSLDRQVSGGMTAFGDALFFLAVFGVAAIPPTVTALLFLVSWWRARRQDAR